MALFGRKKPAPVVEEEVAPAPTLPPAPALDAAGLRSVSDHCTYLLSLVEPLEPFGMSLLEAWAQVMCEDIDAMADVPPMSTSKVDGYAVRAAESRGDASPVFLELDEDGERLEPGTASRVGVGQVVPKGATAVLPTSFATVNDGVLEVIEGVSEGEYLRAAGEHLAAGTRLLSEGDRLGDRSIGILASAGIDKVLVRPRPRVIVIASGEELVDPGERLHHGETPDANSFMIAAAAKAAGATVFRVAVHTSDPDELKQAITDQLIRADLIISTTGGSRADYEAVAGAMADLGLVDSVDVAMTPGRKQTFGLIGDEDEVKVPRVMLPGKPVSAYVSFHAFVWPLIKKLAGAAPQRRAVRAIATSTLRSDLGHLHLLRGRVSSEGSVRHVEQVRDTHAVAELARSNALIVVDEHTDLIRAGEQAMCWLLDESCA